MKKLSLFASMLCLFAVTSAKAQGCVVFHEGVRFATVSDDGAVTYLGTGRISGYLMGSAMNKVSRNGRDIDVTLQAGKIVAWNGNLVGVYDYSGNVFVIAGGRQVASSENCMPEQAAAAAYLSYLSGE